MSNTLPTGERLLLTIDREVDLNCPPCGGRGEVPFCHDAKWPERLPDKLPCMHCHGAGSIAKRIRGWVPVECEVDGYDGSPIEWDYVGCFQHKSATSIEELTDIIIAAHHDGTLPDEIAANIEITDIEEDA